MCGVTGLSSASPPGFDAVCGMQRQHSGILKIFNNSLQTDGFINNRLRGIEKMYTWSVFIFLPIIHNKKNINIINKEIKGFPI